MFRALVLAVVGFGCATAYQPPGDGGQISINDGKRPDSGSTTMNGDKGTDGGSVITGCTLVPQAGCPSGKACDVADLATGSTTCRDVVSPGTEGDTCTTAKECEPGYTCIGSASTAACVRFCKDHSQCVAPGGVCTENIDTITYCTANCDPLTSAGCPGDWGCHFEYDGGLARYYTNCVPSGPGGQGAACITDHDCQQNFSCVNVDGQTACLKNCNDSANSGGGGGTSCNGLTPPATLGAVQYGVCL